MNESSPAISDLQLFLVVADGGSLTEAARRTGTPLPTLSRRMTRLEFNTGRALFLRGKAGYALTADGRALAEAVGGLHDVQRRVRRWQDQATGATQVRITAGTWTAAHLARALAPDPDAGWTPVFVASNAQLDLARREADIGLRNTAPDHPWLARQRMRRIAYAIYATGPEIAGFVALPKTEDLPASQRWLHARHGDEIRATATDPRLCLDLAHRGYGRLVLPCFAGDAAPGLHRLSDEIGELAHDEWLVSHHEARHDPPIRAALTAIRAALVR